MECAEVRTRELIEGFLLGRLDEAEQEAFERHLLECDACFAELQALRVLRSELIREAGERSRDGAAVSRRRPWPWALAAVLLVAAIGLGWWLLPSGDRAWSELAAVEPPAWEPGRLRGAVGESTRLANRAMESYARGEYEQAIPVLVEAARLDPEDAQVQFYLGACYLLEDLPHQAAASLERAAADPLLEEQARFYLAQARLGLGDAAGARAELERVVALQGDREREARELLQLIRGRSRRPG